MLNVRIRIGAAYDEVAVITDNHGASIVDRSSLDRDSRNQFNETLAGCICNERGIVNKKRRYKRRVRN